MQAKNGTVGTEVEVQAEDYVTNNPVVQSFLDHMPFGGVVQLAIDEIKRRADVLEWYVYDLQTRKELSTDAKNYLAKMAINKLDRRMADLEKLMETLKELRSRLEPEEVEENEST